MTLKLRIYRVTIKLLVYSFNIIKILIFSYLFKLFALINLCDGLRFYSNNATTLAGAADAPTIFKGKTAILKPE